MGVKRKVRVATGNEGILLYDAFAEFIADKVVLNKSPKTIDNYEKSFNYFVEYEFDEPNEVDISTVLKPYVMQWVEGMLKDKKRITTINHYLRDVRSFLYWCMDSDRQYIPQYKIELVSGQEELPKIFTDEEVELLLQKPLNQRDFVEWRTWAIVNWVMATGNRAATICNVKLEDINFSKKQIILRHTKNKKAQAIPLSSALERALKQYINKCRSGANVTNESWLFPSCEDEQLTYSALAQSFRNYCKERGTTHTNIHGLRHYFATYWAKNNKDSGDRLQKILGHSTYAMTQKYIELTDEDLKENYDNLVPLDNRNKAKRHRKKVQIN